MFKIHTKDGQTVNVDLADAEQAKVWLPRIQSAGFAPSGVTVQRSHAVRCLACGSSSEMAHQFSLAAPDGARWWLESVPAEKRCKGADRLIVTSGDSRVSITAHNGQPAARVMLSKTGQVRQRYNPKDSRK